MKGFLFGSKDTPWTQEELTRKREVADALLARSLQTPRNGWEGARAIVDALGARKTNKKIAAREGELRGEFDARFNSLFGGGGSGFGQGGGSYGGGSYTPPPPPSQFNQGETETPEQKAAREANSRTSWNGGAVSDMQPNMFSTFGLEAPGGGKSGYNMGTDAAPTMALDVIKGFEGYRDTPYWDVNAFRTGYGSDTVTMADGSIVPVRQGMKITREDAERDLARRVTTEFMPRAAAKVGPEVFASLSEPQQAALASITYNYGDLPDSVARAVASGDPQAAAQAIAALGSHNDGVNAGRRSEEAKLFLQDGGAGGPVPGGSAPQVDPLMFGQMSDPVAPQPTSANLTGGFSMGGGTGGMPGGFDIGTLAALAADPMASPEQKAILNMLLTQQTNAMDPMYQMQLQEQRLKLAEMQGGGQGMRPMTPEELAPWGIPPNSASWGIGPDGTPKQIMEAPGARGGVEYGTSVNYYTKDDGTVGGYIIGKDGSRKEVELPEGGQFGSGTQRVDLGDRWQIIDNRTGTVLREEKKDLAAKESDEALGAAAGKVASSLPTIEANAQAALDRIDAVINDPGLDSIAGNVQGRLPSGIPFVTGGQEGANSAAALAEIQGKLFLAAYDALRGAGAITEAEGKAATDAIANLDLTQDPKLIRAALQRAADKLRLDVENARKKAVQGGGVAAATQTPAAPAEAVQISTDEEYDALPSGAQFIAPDGTVRVKP